LAGALLVSDKQVFSDGTVSCSIAACGLATPGCDISDETGVWRHPVPTEGGKPPDGVFSCVSFTFLLVAFFFAIGH